MSTATTNHDFTVGDFVEEMLVTDTRVYEVIKTTPKTITLRGTKSGEKLENDFPIILTEALTDPLGKLSTLRLRKDGTFRTHKNGWNINPARTVEGKPVRKVDWSF